MSNKVLSPMSAPVIGKKDIYQSPHSNGVTYNRPQTPQAASLKTSSGINGNVSRGPMRYLFIHISCSISFF